MLWGAVAAVCLAGALLVWLGSATAAGHGLFGAGGSTAVVAAGLVLTLLGLVGARVPAAGRGLRWVFALVLTVGGGAVGALAFGAFFAPQDTGDVAVGALLILGAMGMTVLAVQVSRATPA